MSCDHGRVLSDLLGSSCSVIDEHHCLRSQFSPQATFWVIRFTSKRDLLPLPLPYENLNVMDPKDLQLLASKKHELLHAAQEARKLSYSPYR